MYRMAVVENEVKRREEWRMRKRRVGKGGREGGKEMRGEED